MRGVFVEWRASQLPGDASNTCFVIFIPDSEEYAARKTDLPALIQHIHFLYYPPFI
jgi:hypothetical protein